MAIRARTRQQCDHVRTERPTLVPLSDHTGQRLGDDTRLVLGAITDRRCDLSWSCVVVVIAPRGQCLAGDRESAVQDQADARRRWLDHRATAVTPRDSAPSDPPAHNTGSASQALICFACHRLSKDSAVLVLAYRAALDALAATSRFDHAHATRACELAGVAARLYEAQQFEQRHHDRHGHLERRYE